MNMPFMKINMKFAHSALFLLVLLFPINAYNQKLDFSVGIEGGPGISFCKLDFFSGPTGPILCGAFSVMGHLDIDKKMALRSGVSLSQIGFADDDYYQNRLTYLQIPVLLNFYLGSKKIFYFTFGAFLGFLVDAKSDNNYDPHIYSEYNNFNWGITPGFGVKIPIIKRMYLITEIRNDLGLYKVQHTETHYNPAGLPKNVTVSYFTNSTFLNIGLYYTF
jgi:hypothetical protein